MSIIVIVEIIAGLGLLLVGGDLVVRAALGAAFHWRISPTVASIAIIGLGTSLPEIFLGVEASIAGHGEIAIGTVFGSNIANLLLILSVAALIRPMRFPPRGIVPDGVLLIAVTLVTVAMVQTGVVARWQGAIMVVVLAGFMAWMFLLRKHATTLEDTSRPPAWAGHPAAAAGLGIAGLIALPVGAGWLIDGVADMASSLGVSQGVISLTIVAIGTSLPELASAVAAATHGRSDVTYGNVVGSNLFNTLAVLGLAAVANPVPVSTDIMHVDAAVMLAATLGALVLLATRCRLGRPEAAAMLVCYLVYLSARYAI